MNPTSSPDDPRATTPWTVVVNSAAGSSEDDVVDAVVAALRGSVEVEVARTEDLQILWLGPDEWLLVGPEGSADRIQAALVEAIDAEHGSVVDVSDHRTIVEVRGPVSRELLAKGCGLDLHRRSFTAGQCAQTLLARAGVVLVCRDAEQPSFWIFVRASFARYLADWLADAAAEYRA